ncbi:16S rRNA (cytosine(967)-C(5))-methyltransferase [Bacterioplanes sanyensis]|uniref:16S rRNA (cytosine(967)-C(5))-methyltransferase n=1 Tax=Bacterioplanes sanyensis TaxID=1249553 RepID=A0A222FP88_9GAMM|nr:16S rRNA (cytosine(967)-C(5))-methyltransferase [Bacterioplanes sanyensis]
MSARAAAARALSLVMQGQSLNQALPMLEPRVDESDRGFLRDLVLGSCRHYQRLNALAKMLLKSPFDDSDQDLHALLVIGLYQLHMQGKAPHAAVHATVDVCEELGKGYGKAVINACLRRFGREYDSLTPALDDNPVTATSHPKWLVKMLNKAWPEQAAAILHSNNDKPPLCLRVNRRQVSRDDYLQQLQQADIDARPAPFSDDGIYLNTGLDVTTLPGFAAGFVSVQDEAAQLAAQLLQPQNGEQILDACAAPGGKTCHLLEHADVHVTAVDIDQQRLQRVQENLDRLQLSAELTCADMLQASSWQKQQYDAILLDVPCSATGVIRRHPDIKLLRRRDDIDALVHTQATLLDLAWSALKPGGRLLYATCSVLPQENSEQIAQFVARTDNAELQILDKPWGNACNAGRQLLPQTDSHDGFYYALLQKA